MRGTSAIAVAGFTTSLALACTAQDFSIECEEAVYAGWLQEGCDVAQLPAAVIGEHCYDGFESEGSARQWGETAGVTECQSAGGGGGGGNACYDTGWTDCVDAYVPDTSLSGQCGADYEVGYCDCEAEYWGFYEFCE